MRPRKGEELLRLVVDNKCVPLTRGPARRGADTNTCRARGESVEQICAFLGLKKTLVYEVLKRHREGEPLEQRNPSKRARIRGPQLKAIQNFVSYDETLFLAELQTKLRLVYGESYSPSLICRALKLLGLRRKKVSTGVTCPLTVRLSHSLALLCSVTAEQWSGTRPSAWSSHATSARTSRWTSACFEGVHNLGLCDCVLRLCITTQSCVERAESTTACWFAASVSAHRQVLQARLMLPASCLQCSRRRCGCSTASRLLGKGAAVLVGTVRTSPVAQLTSKRAFFFCSSLHAAEPT